jgi:hypothetical protein
VGIPASAETLEEGHGDDVSHGQIRRDRHRRHEYNRNDRDSTYYQPLHKSQISLKPEPSGVGIPASAILIDKTFILDLLFLTFCTVNLPRRAYTTIYIDRYVNPWFVSWILIRIVVSHF